MPAQVQVTVCILGMCLKTGAQVHTQRGGIAEMDSVRVGDGDGIVTRKTSARPDKTPNPKGAAPTTAVLQPN